MIWLVIQIANRIKKVSWNSQQNNWETVTNEHDKEILKEKYVSPEERQEIIDELWYNAPNQPTKFSTKNWVEINDDACGTYNTNSQIKFKTSILRLSLCDYSHGYDS